MDLFKSLIYNLSLIISLSFISGFINERLHKKRNLNLFFQIIIFSAITIYSIFNPVSISDVFKFDGRSILILLSTLFFGMPVGLATLIVALAARLFLIKINIMTVLATVFIPFIIGYIFYNLTNKKLFQINLLSLLLIGVLNSLLIFFSLLFLSPINDDEYLEIEKVALIVYPVITMFTGLVLNNSFIKTKLLTEVQENESKWKAIFYNIQDGIITIDLYGRINNINDNFKELFKVDESNISGKFIEDLMTMKEIETNNKIDLKFDINDIFNNKDYFSDKKVIVCFNGLELPVVINLKEIIFKSGEKLGFLIILRDIRDELENQKKLIESEQTFRGIFNSIQEAIYIQDIDGKFIDVNEGAIKMYEYEKEDFIGNSPAFLSAEGKNDNLDLKTLLNRAYNGEPQIFEFWGKKKGGTIFPKIVSLYPGEYFGQKVIIAVAVDISNLRLAQEKLIEQEKLLRILINATPDIIYLKDGDGNWIEINKGMMDLLGIDENKLSRSNNPDIVDIIDESSKDILKSFERIEESTWLNKSLTRIEQWFTNQYGEELCFDIITVPLFNEDNTRKNIILIGRDITLKKKDEEEKRIVLNKLSAVIENFDGGILLEDQNNKIEYLNDNFIRLFKVKSSKENIKLLNIYELFNYINDKLINTEGFPELLLQLQSNNKKISVSEFNTNDGRIIEITYIPVFYDKIISNHLWIFRDVTDLKLNELKLKSKVSELEKFNKSMVERELRMIELKKEINDLLIKAGLPEKYKIIS